MNRYMESYAGGSEEVTQSIFDLSRVEAAAEAVHELARALIVALPTAGYVTIAKAVKNVQRFERRDFADLGDFCALLRAGDPGEAVKTAALGVIDALTGADGLVTAAGQRAPGVERATGAAIYLPLVGDVTVVYDRLDFATQTHWNQFLTRYREA